MRRTSIAVGNGTAVVEHCVERSGRHTATAPPSPVVHLDAARQGKFARSARSPGRLGRAVWHTHYLSSFGLGEARQLGGHGFSFHPRLARAAVPGSGVTFQERGIVISGFLSGYRWTTHSQRGSRLNNGQLAEFFATHNGDQICERAREGQLLAFVAEGRDSYRVCRCTPFGRSFLPDTAQSLFDLGVTTIHDDQDHGPYPDGIESCFDTTHGHPVPCGPWSTEATRQSLRKIRAEAARRGLVDFFLTKESCTDLLNIDLHAYQARFFHESTSPGLVPLAQYPVSRADPGDLRLGYRQQPIDLGVGGHARLRTDSQSRLLECPCGMSGYHTVSRTDPAG